MEPYLKWNKIILAWIFMRQCCSQSLHSCTVIARQQPAVAGRQKSEISDVNGRNAQEDELHRHAKFGRNRSNRGQDMAIYRFFQDGAVRLLGFVMCVCVCSDHSRRAFGGLYRCAKFGWNRCSTVVLIICVCFDFRSLVWKRLFTPQNGFFGRFDPLNRGYLNATPKRH